MKCPHEDENLENCNCTYEPCPRKGKCCQCIKYHLARQELPACCFSNQAEATYDRSFKKFIEDHS